MASWTEHPNRGRRPTRRPDLPALPWRRRLARSLTAVRMSVLRSRNRRVAQRAGAR
jgi:hypothetical protein